MGKDMMSIGTTGGEASDIGEGGIDNYQGRGGKYVATKSG